MAKVTDSEWTMEKGAMPRLQRLVIERCNFKNDAPGRTMVLECFEGCGSSTSRTRIGRYASTVADEGWM